MYIDLGLLVIFCILVAIFLNKKRKKLKKEGIFLLYKTKIGLKFIDNFARRFAKPLNFIAYISITFGYLAMIIMVILLIYNVIVLAQMPEVISAPPIMPVIPYAPQIFKIPGLPDFYFIHWIVILIVLAITHEFAHGIFARLKGIRIKSTGFGFLGPVILAFVEQDEKQMNKKKKKDQLAMLSAGPFSNFVFCIVFGLLFLLFLNLSIIPTTPLYAGTTINSSQIDSLVINHDIFNYSDFSSLNKNEFKNLPDKILVNADNITYVLTQSSFLGQLDKIQNHTETPIVVYYNSPLINLGIKGELLKINGIEVKHPQIFDELQKIEPYQQIKIETSKGNYLLVADKNPNNASKGFIGLNYRMTSNTFADKFQRTLTPLNRNPFMSYGPAYNNDLYTFFSTFFFWMVMLLFAVATFNMLPFAFLDGGKFFYLTALAITKKKKSAELIYRIASIFIILIFIAMMLVWAYRMWLYKLFV
jgi:membrane-associated protease RseP (regulator of RpoE activity)